MQPTFYIHVATEDSQYVEKLVSKETADRYIEELVSEAQEAGSKVVFCRSIGEWKPEYTGTNTTLVLIIKGDIIVPKAETVVTKWSV